MTRSEDTGPLAPVTAGMEDYLSTIYALLAEGELVISARLAEHLGVGPSSVTGMLKRLIDAGYVQFNDRREILLTESGRAIAENAVRRHRLAERILTDLLGFDWVEAHTEAHSLEHGLTPKIVDRFFHVLGRPQTCPHGSPIPGSDADVNWVGMPLNRLRVGDAVTIDRVTESGEMDHQLLAKLGEVGITPGAEAVVSEVAPWSNSMTLELKGHEVELDLVDAAKIWTRPPFGSSNN